MRIAVSWLAALAVVGALACTRTPTGPVEPAPATAASAAAPATAPAAAPAPAARTSASASATRPPPSYAQVTFADLPGWREDTVGDALQPLRRSCQKLAELADDQPIGRPAIGGRAGDWRALCAQASDLDASDHTATRAFFERHFTPLAVIARTAGQPGAAPTGRSDAAPADPAIGRFSGYYVAALRGSTRRHGRYQTPIYGLPPDLVTVYLNDFLPDGRSRKVMGRVVKGRLEPYDTRRQIEAGALAGKNLELLWVDDPVDAFFAQVQGSGRVAMEDGRVLRIGYAGKNGHEYTAIGRVLIADGELTRATVSMQSIRAWMNEHPKQAQELMNKNDSFVFFAIKDTEGPMGSQGVALSPERSMAVDRESIPLSMPMWVDITAPVAGTRGTQVQPWRRLLIAQDTGGAILGAVRGDIYWGGTERAADLAGHMKSRGRYFALVPRIVLQRGDVTLVERPGR